MKALNLTIAIVLAFAINAKSQIITTIAGGFTGNGAKSKSLSINTSNIAVDKAGNVYWADNNRHVVLQFLPSGICHVYAGNGISGNSGDGGPAKAAELMSPYFITVDSSGNLYIMDAADNRLRKISPAGIISTIAGTGVGGFSGDGGPAVSAQISGGNAIVTDNKGNIYITAGDQSRVRKIDTAGIITTIAGTGDYGATGDGGPADSAKLGFPWGLAINKTGEIFITDVAFNHIRKIDTSGIITTFAGPQAGGSGFSGDGGPAAAAVFSTLSGGVTFDTANNVYIADAGNNRIRKVDTSGIITTAAGNGTVTYGTDGISLYIGAGDGDSATKAVVIYPVGVAADGSGNLFIAEAYRLRKVNTKGIISTYAGNGFRGFNGDSILATSSQLFDPIDVVTDGKGGLLIADVSADHLLRRVDSKGIITTVAGNGSQAAPDSIKAIDAGFGLVRDIARDKAGNIFIPNGNVIKKIDTTGIITTIAGLGGYGFGGDGGPAKDAMFKFVAIALDKDENILVVDRDNNRIRKITKDGIVNTIAGNGSGGFSGDEGLAVNASLHTPTRVCADTAGNIYIADNLNRRIRKITPDGIIHTIAGNGNSAFSGDGDSALLAGLVPYAITIDGEGNIFFTDVINNRVRKIDTSGIITTIAGGGATYADGVLAINSSLAQPVSVTVDSSGNIFIPDMLNSRIRKIAPGLLPLKLLSFNAAQNNNNVFVNWKTSNEINVEGYNIERSENASTFIKVGTVPATRQANYVFTDTTVAQLKAKTVYYRLQMLDKDGKYTYSKTVPVTFKFDAPLFSVYPNPAQKIINISGEGIKYIAVLTTDGKIVIKHLVTNYNTSINIGALSKGVYLVKTYNTDGSTQTQKLLVQ